MKRVSLFVLAVSTSVALWAQPDQPKLKTDMASQTRFGIRAGANLANYNTEGFPGANTPSVNTKTSMQAGVFVNVPLGTMFAFQPGVEYSGQGSKINYTGASIANISPAAGQYEEDLHYINIPMMVQWKPAGAGGFFLETGPQPGFLIAATRDNTTANTEADIKAQRDKFDLSWGAGLGYLTRVGLGFNARYNYGLTNTIEDSNNSTNSGPELKNRTIQLGLVYHFGANK